MINHITYNLTSSAFFFNLFIVFLTMTMLSEAKSVKQTFERQFIFRNLKVKIVEKLKHLQTKSFVLISRLVVLR